MFTKRRAMQIVLGFLGAMIALDILISLLVVEIVRAIG